MIYISEKEIENLLTEDVPYYDLTTTILRIENKAAKIQYITKQDTVVCCTEEVMKMFNKLAIIPTLFTQSGEFIEKGVKFLEGEGLSKNIHTMWRASENLLGFASGIASRTRNIVEKARKVNPSIIISTNRRTIPYTKKIAIKAVQAGGASVHRLGLSESILIFENHYSFLGNFQNLKKRIEEQKNSIPGKHIAIEVRKAQFGMEVARSGMFDFLYLKDFEVDEIKKLKHSLMEEKLNTQLIVSGEIDGDNIIEYAKSGADILVTSWPYFATPAAFNIVINPIID